MSEPKKNALVLHLASGGEPLVYALSPAAAEDLASRLPTVLTSGAVDAPELEDGATVAINFAHIATAHFDELPPLSRVYGSAAKSGRGFRA
ncbi:hypothetical protein [Kibdelosporangium phytohabitans]|uniref:Uncharacterized protein n=1 Tax=Kibdelosporangium phytohabitans TaxID=860235 RepID=A0A0N9HRF4_9PSEU|nr:hypothetical protein [Kibdelosporangium phytohabitans]ALG05694.1 hypothetical protein AOZ06_00990 [Kibdelosporangium phytohabitans]MBE1466324.1 hypothetical protein [Kibdelosporangium phytohabitans]